ncbi:MAG TPA: histidinol-phosphatase [Rectinemataceae bacterium]|nr:histidinol-phosphatase [Rectinemataceae bacterium]
MNNYHTHTFRCRHAQGDVADYVAAAADAGLSELGFSDHCPYPDGRWPSVRMAMADLPDYLEALRTAKTRAAASASSPRILSGLECEWSPEYESFFREEYLGRLGLDYLAGGIHSYLHGGEWRDTFAISEASELGYFAETTCRAIESGLFAFLAHPDVFCFSWLPWDESARSCAADILSTAESSGCLLEINGYGMRKKKVGGAGGTRPPYPRPEFWRLASDYDITCIVNSDAHRPVDTAANLAEGRELAARFGLKVAEALPLQNASHKIGK